MTNYTIQPEEDVLQIAFHRVNSMIHQVYGSTSKAQPVYAGATFIATDWRSSVDSFDNRTCARLRAAIFGVDFVSYIVKIDYASSLLCGKSFVIRYQHSLQTQVFFILPRIYLRTYRLCGSAGSCHFIQLRLCTLHVP